MAQFTVPSVILWSWLLWTCCMCFFHSRSSLLIPNVPSLEKAWWSHWPLCLSLELDITLQLHINKLMQGPAGSAFLPHFGECEQISCLPPFPLCVPMQRAASEEGGISIRNIAGESEGLKLFLSTPCSPGAVLCFTSPVAELLGERLESCIILEYCSKSWQLFLKNKNLREFPI